MAGTRRGRQCDDGEREVQFELVGELKVEEQLGQEVQFEFVTFGLEFWIRDEAIRFGIV